MHREKEIWNSEFDSLILVGANNHQELSISPTLISEVAASGWNKLDDDSDFCSDL